MQVNDRVTKNLFEEVAEAEERHIDVLEQQVELIKQVGIQLYSQKHIGEIERSTD
jgi:bacterioferritin